MDETYPPPPPPDKRDGSAPSQESSTTPKSPPPAPTTSPPIAHAPAAASAGAAQGEPASSAAHAAAPTFSRWRVARAAGAGAATAFVLATGLSGPGSFLHEPFEKKVQFAMAGVVLVILAISIVEPFLEWLHRGEHHGDPHAGRPWRRTIGTLLVILLTFIFVAMDGLLHETLAGLDAGFLGKWFGSFLSACVVTYAWTRGVHRGPPFATIYGTATAVGAMILMWLFIIFFLLLGALADSKNVTVAQLVEGIVGFSLLWVIPISVWFLCGFLGGLALDFGRLIPPAVRVFLVISFTWGL